MLHLDLVDICHRLSSVEQRLHLQIWCACPKKRLHGVWNSLAETHFLSATELGCVYCDEQSLDTPFGSMPNYLFSTLTIGVDVARDISIDLVVIKR